MSADEWEITAGPPIGAAEAPLLVALVSGRKCDSAEAPRLVGAFRDEVLREAAEKIRLHKDEARGAVQATKVVDFCADLIDPDKT